MRAQISTTAFLLLWRERGLRQRNGENLIGAESGVVSNSGGVDDVIATTCRSVPKLRKTMLHLRCEFCERFDGFFYQRCEAGYRLERIKPQRINLHGLSDSRRHHPVADFGIHPGELHAGFTGVKQAILVHMNLVARSGYVRADHLVHDREKLCEGGGVLCRRKILAHGFEKPQRGVHGVVFGAAAGVGKIVG